MKTTRADSRREGGQTLLIFVLALTVLLGMTAMAIDVGLLFEDRRHMQNTADAAALAGVAELPGNPAAAVQLVNNLDLYVKNGTTSYKGNVLSNGVSYAGGVADSLRKSLPYATKPMKQAVIRMIRVPTRIPHRRSPAPIDWPTSVVADEAMP